MRPLFELDTYPFITCKKTIIQLINSIQFIFLKFENVILTDNECRQILNDSDTYADRNKIKNSTVYVSPITEEFQK